MTDAASRHATTTPAHAGACEPRAPGGVLKLVRMEDGFWLVFEHFGTFFFVKDLDGRMNSANE